jgi:hypothetical protein
MARTPPSRRHRHLPRFCASYLNPEPEPARGRSAAVRAYGRGAINFAEHGSGAGTPIRGPGVVTLRKRTGSLQFASGASNAVLGAWTAAWNRRSRRERSRTTRHPTVGRDRAAEHRGGRVRPGWNSPYHPLHDCWTEATRGARRRPLCSRSDSDLPPATRLLDGSDPASDAVDRAGHRAVSRAAATGHMDGQESAASLVGWGSVTAADKNCSL